VNGSSVFGIAGDLPFAGDWTGVGTHRLGLFRPSSAVMAIETQLGNGPDTTFTFGTPSDLPVAGHWVPVVP
jgi:hypothetical protein